MSCEYVRKYYGVPACIGRRISVDGREGIIAEDRGHYIGVNFDDEKPSFVHNYHPKTKGLKYLGMGKIRQMSRSQKRYQRYLEYGDRFNNFLDFCYWHDDPERSWNGGNEYGKYY